MIVFAVICLTAGILLGNAWVGMRSSSVYTSIRNEDSYLLEFHPLNMEHAETYQLAEGGRIVWKRLGEHGKESTTPADACQEA